MTLQVPFEDFPATIKRLLGLSDAYLKAHPRGTLITAALPEGRIIVAAVADVTMRQAEHILERQGVTAWAGGWSSEGVLDAEFVTSRRPYVAAVAYRTEEDRPGLWVDAYDDEPTELQVLEYMHREFVHTGQIDDLPFDDFLKLAQANVVCLSPDEIENYAADKRSRTEA
ncbi:MAG: hypothetical protein SFX74_06540 [Fimbriimonadaceae bacterium]|nr:hypothetical protein [Fimbriimonadaceae bacterium]